VKNVDRQRDFYAPRRSAGAFTDFGPDYAATTGGDVDVGLNGSEDEAIAGICCRSSR
jgi:hypothetical protein